MSILIPEHFRVFFEASLTKWSLGARYKVLKVLDGGRTNASVYVVDLVSHPKDKLRSGQYVLKLQAKGEQWSKEDPEHQRHLDAQTWSATFGQRHMPTLVDYSDDGNNIGILYEVAGHSLAAVVTADSIEAGALEHYGRLVSHKILSDLNASYAIEHDFTAKSMLTSWLGYRLDPERAPLLHSFVAKELGDYAEVIMGGQVLVNPMWLCMSESLDTQETVCFDGVIHGDLHPGNIMIDRQQIPADQFWLIDFALSRKAPLFYDNAYLELALLLNGLDGLGKERMIGMLTALDAPKERQTYYVPVPDVGLLKCLQAIRDGADDWQASKEALRKDVYKAQQLLARTAAALNWANKSITLPNKRLALAYGCWAAKGYVESYAPDIWKGVQSLAEGRRQSASSHDIAAPHKDPFKLPPQWLDIWEECARFDESTTTFILVTGAFGRAQDLRGLALLPWAAIVDLDPLSDDGGFASMVATTLATLRSTHQYGKTPLSLPAGRGTAWLMAGGWPSHLEPVPTSLSDWRRTYLRCIRDLLVALRAVTTPKPMKVVVLPGPGLEDDRISRILEVIDEVLGDCVDIILLGQYSGDTSSLTLNRHEMTPCDFAACVQTTFGTQTLALEATIPAATGTVPVPLDRLRNWEEDLDVLHSRILLDLPSGAHIDDFWRGHPPSWTDLHAGADIPRTINNRLVERLGALLDHGRSHALELHHLPGAGGTTAGLRAIFSLRASYPTAVLRRLSRLTVDRLDQMFQLAQKPLLLLAESSEISPAARDQLFRDLASRNSRVVILYIVRTTSVDTTREFFVAHPMEPEETATFLEQFSKRTKDQQKRKKLAKIAQSSDSRYICPFFFGLTVYAEDFSSIDRYVRIFLEGTSYTIQKLLRYIAMVTRFSQVGIDESLLRRMVGLQSTSLEPVENILGGNARQLVVKVGRELRLLHPAIADEVLKQLLGGSRDWRDGLKDLATDFIRECVSLLSADSRYLDKLFTHLFIRRDEWAVPGLRTNFSELIIAIPSKAGQHQVFQLLTEVCPLQPHYWNHLGRHHIYEMQHDHSTADIYLRRAVNLAPLDPFHHHTLGMVLRFWVRDQVRDMLRQPGESVPPVEMLRRVRDLAGRATECFAQTRNLQPEVAHGYITHIQMILEIAERLMRASGSNSMLDIKNQKDEVAEWIRTNVVVAEDLLARVAHMRADGDPSRFEVNCGGRLKNLFGDFVTAIKAWEEMLLHPTSEQATIRRAVASAYFCRARRLWSQLSLDELVRTSELMEQNLHEDPANDRDIRTWFQAYKRLPDFSYLQALDRLEAWAARTDSLEAHYYCYVLHFLLWRDEVSRTEAQTVNHLERCIDLAVGRRGHSYEWLALGPDWCPLVHHTELGGFNRQKGFYNDPSKLDRAEGVIESMKGPQSGMIKVGQATRAFFVPGTEFWESQHINAVVNFNLGFAYGGLRAWRVSPGRLGTAAGVAPEHRVPTARRETPISPRSTHTINVVSQRPSPERQPAKPTPPVRPVSDRPGNRPESSIYVGNIPYHSTNEELAGVFSLFGVIVRVHIPIDSGSGLVRGFAFVQFVDPQSAKAALAHRSALVLRGRVLRLGPSNRNLE